MSQKRARVLLISMFVLDIGLLFLPGSGKPASAISSSFVISQFQVAGSTAADEFIEIHNVSGRSLPLNGYKLVYRTDGSSSDFLMFTFGSMSVPAGGYYLLANAGYDGSIARDATYTGALSAAGGGIALREPGDAIVDSVGYGIDPNDFTEGLKVAAPGSNQSRVRGSLGCADSDHNSIDFLLLNPAAGRNSFSTPGLCVPLDLAPAILTTTPADGAAAVPVDGNIEILFSEPVAFGTEGSFLISCGGTPQAALASGSGTTFTLDPVADFPASVSCEVTILASGVTDLDGWPDHPAEDYSFTFTTAPPDNPPAVTGNIPVGGAVDVAVDTAIRVDFSEPVSLAPGFASIACTSGEHAYGVDSTGNPQINLTPLVDFAYGDTCMVTIHAQAVTDLDGAPNAMTTDWSWSFTVLYESAPFLVMAEPDNAAVGVALDANLELTFSEPVSLDPAWIDLVCSLSGDHAVQVDAGPGGSSLTLDPELGFQFGETCGVTIHSTKVHDQDPEDPFDCMASDITWSFQAQLPAHRTYISLVFVISGY